MKYFLPLLLAASALWLGGCASSSIKNTWKSPTYKDGPVQKIAVIAVDERGLVRQGFENRLVHNLRARGQEAMVTFDLMSLPEIKADKEAAAAKLRAAGVDSVLIVRLVDRTAYNRSVRATSAQYMATATGIHSYTGWYDCYTVAYTDVGTVWGSDVQMVFLDSSLHDLKADGQIWSALTETVVKSDSDRLVEADKLCALIVTAMQADGMIH